MLIAVCCAGADFRGLRAAAMPPVGGQVPARMQSGPMLFDISPQDLKAALDIYQAATGQSVLYETHLVEGRRSAAVRGRLSARQALCTHAAAQPGRHRMVVRYWLDDDGRIDQVRVRIAAAPALEPEVRTALTGLHVGRPPEGMPRSTVVLIRPGAGQRAVCANPDAAKDEILLRPEVRHE